MAPLTRDEQDHVHTTTGIEDLEVRYDCNTNNINEFVDETTSTFCKSEQVLSNLRFPCEINQ